MVKFLSKAYFIPLVLIITLNLFAQTPVLKIDFSKEKAALKPIFFLKSKDFHRIDISKAFPNSTTNVDDFKNLAFSNIILNDNISYLEIASFDELYEATNSSQRCSDILNKLVAHLNPLLTSGKIKAISFENTPISNSSSENLIGAFIESFSTFHKNVKALSSVVKIELVLYIDNGFNPKNFDKIVYELNKQKTLPDFITIYGSDLSIEYADFYAKSVRKSLEQYAIANVKIVLESPSPKTKMHYDSETLAMENVIYVLQDSTFDAAAFHASYLTNAPLDENGNFENFELFLKESYFTFKMESVLNSLPTRVAVDDLPSENIFADASFGGKNAAIVVSNYNNSIKRVKLDMQANVLFAYLTSKDFKFTELNSLVKKDILTLPPQSAVLIIAKINNDNLADVNDMPSPKIEDFVLSSLDHFTVSELFVSSEVTSKAELPNIDETQGAVKSANKTLIDAMFPEIFADDIISNDSYEQFMRKYLPEGWIAELRFAYSSTSATTSKDTLSLGAKITKIWNDILELNLSGAYDYTKERIYSFDWDKSQMTSKTKVATDKYHAEGSLKYKFMGRDSEWFAIYSPSYRVNTTKDIAGQIDNFIGIGYTLKEFEDYGLTLQLSTGFSPQITRIARLNFYGKKFDWTCSYFMPSWQTRESLVLKICKNLTFEQELRFSRDLNGWFGSFDPYNIKDWETNSTIFNYYSLYFSAGLKYSPIRALSIFVKYSYEYDALGMSNMFNDESKFIIGVEIPLGWKE